MIKYILSITTLDIIENVVFYIFSRVTVKRIKTVTTW